MKKLILLFSAILALGSCNQKPQDNGGLGILKLGTPFESLPFSNDFENYMDNEYFIGTYKLSDEIGYVSNLNVTTDQGKISEVKFTGSSETKSAGVEKLLSNFLEQKAQTKPALKHVNLPEIKFYISADSATFVSVVQKGTRKGVPVNEYQFTTRDAVIKKVAQHNKKLGL